MSVQEVARWINKAKPAPTERDVDVQLGVHFEEVAEMVATLEGVTASADILLEEAHDILHKLAESLKRGQISVKCKDRKEMLDALCDQIVTATGVGVLLKMDVVEGLNRVNTSNWSKFVDGEPIFDAHGKIAKGPAYKKCDLEGLY